MLNIAIFMPFKGLSTNTKVLCLVHALAGMGVRIDLYIGGNTELELAPLNPLHPHITLLDLQIEGHPPKPFSAESFVSDSCRELIVARAAEMLYDYAIAVEAPGLLYARFLHETTGCAFAYMSQKLKAASRCGVWSAAEVENLHDLEQEYLFDADLFLIQDEERADSYFENLGLRRRHPNLLHFPASVMDTQIPARTRYWHEKFGLLDEDRVILSIGHFTCRNIKNELIECCQSMPEDEVLVLHGVFEEDLMAALQPAVATGRVMVSTELVDWQQIPYLVASADVGLASFCADDANQYLAAKASTTVAHFARCGIPMIFPDFPGFRRLAEQYGNGICIETPNELDAAVQALLNQYFRFSSGARDVFDKLFNIHLHAERLWEYIRDFKNKRFFTTPKEQKFCKVDTVELATQYSVAALLARAKRG